jgi:hypothetical protein
MIDKILIGLAIWTLLSLVAGLVIGPWLKGRQP